MNDKVINFDELTAENISTDFLFSTHFEALDNFKKQLASLQASIDSLANNNLGDIDIINSLMLEANKAMNKLNSAYSSYRFENENNSSSHNQKLSPADLDINWQLYSIKKITEYCYKLVLPPIPYTSINYYKAADIINHKKLIEKVIQHLSSQIPIQQFQYVDLIIQHILPSGKFNIDHDHRLIHYLLNALSPTFFPDDSSNYCSIFQCTNHINSNVNNTENTIVYIINNERKTADNFSEILARYIYNKEN